MEEKETQWGLFSIVCMSLANYLYILLAFGIVFFQPFSCLPVTSPFVVATRVALFFAIAAFHLFVTWNHIPLFSALVVRQQWLIAVAVAGFALYGIYVQAGFPLLHPDSSPDVGIACFVIGVAAYALAGISLATFELPAAIIWSMHTNWSHRIDETKHEATHRQHLAVFFTITGTFLLAALSAVAIHAAALPASVAFGLIVAIFILAVLFLAMCNGFTSKSRTITTAPVRHINELFTEENTTNYLPPYIGGFIGGASLVALLCCAPAVVGEATAALLAIGAITIVATLYGLFRALHYRVMPTFYTSVKYVILAQGILTLITCLSSIWPATYLLYLAALVESLFVLLVCFSASCKAADAAFTSPLFFTSRAVSRFFTGAALGLIVAYAAACLIGASASTLIAVICTAIAIMFLFLDTRSFDDMESSFVPADGLAAEGFAADGSAEGGEAPTGNATRRPRGRGTGRTSARSTSDEPPAPLSPGVRQAIDKKRMQPDPPAEPIEPAELAEPTASDKPTGFAESAGRRQNAAILADPTPTKTPGRPIAGVTSDDAPLREYDGALRPGLTKAEYGRWKQCALAVAQEHGLTSREQEILMMLAKGRNAQFISNDLTISINTAKTHIYRIYRKLDVQCRQELIDMVDAKQRAMREQEDE